MDIKEEIKRLESEIKKLQDMKDDLEDKHHDEMREMNKDTMQKLYDSIKQCIQDHKVILRGGGHKPKIVDGILTCDKVNGVVLYEIPFDVTMNPVWIHDYKVTWYNTIYAKIHFDDGKCVGCSIYHGSDSHLSSEYDEIHEIIDDIEFISNDEFKKDIESAVNTCYVK